MSLDKETNEFRVVRQKIFGFPLWVKSVQRKYLVQNGVPYSPPNFGPPDNKHDVYINIIDGLPMWQPMKEEWRNIGEI